MLYVILCYVKIVFCYHVRNLKILGHRRLRGQSQHGPVNFSKFTQPRKMLVLSHNWSDLLK